MRPERALVAVFVAVLVAASLPLSASLARADGDPASDVLLGTDVFYPYAPTSQSDESALNAAVATLRKDKDPVKIAIIGAPTDLGVIPSLFDHAPQYAQFLDTEISFTGPEPLLVVMPSGFGTQHLSDAATRAVAGLPKPSGGSSHDLARAALKAVDAIADADGHSLAGAGSTGSVPASGGNGKSGGTLIVIALLVVALLSAAALVAITLRRRQTPA